MARLGPYEVHPFADKFPLIEGSEFEDLVSDIKRNGQREPVLLNHDETVLIDGRNRYRACEAAGVSPKITTLPTNYTETQILDLIISANIERRHLEKGQRSFLALDYEAAYAEANKVAQSGNGKAKPHRESISVRADLTRNRHHRRARQKNDDLVNAPQRAVGASGRGVQQAKAVQRDTPDLAEKVRTGQIALDKADRERRQRIRNQPKPEPVNSGPAPLLLRTHDGQEFPYPQPKGKATFNQTPGEGISWAEWSWNPVTGCLHGCDYCYAREIAHKRAGSRRYYPAGFTPLFHERTPRRTRATPPSRPRTATRTPSTACSSAPWPTSTAGGCQTSGFSRYTPRCSPARDGNTCS